MRTRFAGWASERAAYATARSFSIDPDCEENWAAFDGWLFNDRQLEAEFGTASGSPGDLVLASYMRWGDAFATRLEGEYAFAIWDARKRRLLLGRDSTGYRPLYYALKGTELHFATEPKVLLDALHMRSVPDPGHIARWLAMVSNQDDTTFFRGIHRVHAGHTVAFEGGQLRVSRFFDPEQVKELRLHDTAEYAEALLAVLDRAVVDRVDAGGRIGTQLSGGLDSSSVTALTANRLAERNARLLAFTAVPVHETHAGQHRGRFCDEGAHAASVACMYPNVDHVLIPNKSHSLFHIVDLLSTAGQNPVLNPQHCLWLYEISRQARLRGVDTMFDSAVGNVTVSYDGALVLSSLIAEGRWRDAMRLGGDFHKRNRSSWRSLLFGALAPFMPITVVDISTRIRSGQISGRPVSLLRPSFAREQGVDPRAADASLHTPDSRVLRSRALYRLDPGARAAAYWEATKVWRTDPTFDPRVVRFCLSIPVERYCEGGVKRSLIRDAMRGKISETVRTETRRGLQSADFLVHLRAEMPELKRELQRARDSDLLTRALDLPKMEQMVNWSEEQIRSFGWGAHLAILMRAVSLARFVRRMEDGTLFSSPGASPAVGFCA